jgi:hypothetical protein
MAEVSIAEGRPSQLSGMESLGGVELVIHGGLQKLVLCVQLSHLVLEIGLKFVTLLQELLLSLEVFGLTVFTPWRGMAVVGVSEISLRIGVL